MLIFIFFFDLVIYLSDFTSTSAAFSRFVFGRDAEYPTRDVWCSSRDQYAVANAEGTRLDTQKSPCYHVDSFQSLTPPQLSKAAAERNEGSRCLYRFHIGHESPERLVFLDESRIDCRTTYRLYGWAEKGQRARVKSKFVRGTGYVFFIYAIPSAFYSVSDILSSLPFPAKESYIMLYEKAHMMAPPSSCSFASFSFA